MKKSRRILIIVIITGLIMLLLLAGIVDDYANPPVAISLPPATSPPPVIPSPSQPADVVLPVFPWPPPPASAAATIPNSWASQAEQVRLADVAARLENAMQVAGYPRWSYSSVPNGFALVSQMEQIMPDGSPSPEQSRWSTEMPWVENLTLFEFIKALANATPGYYRVIVFIVTDQPWSRIGERPTGKEAEKWLSEGLNWLPQSIGEMPYGPNSKTVVLVYEFKKFSEDADAAFHEQSSVSAYDHLRKAGISNYLGLW